MTFQEFEIEIRALVDVFGKAEYAAPRVAAIWEKVSDLDVRSMRKIVKHFIDTRSVKSPPLPTHFLEAYHEMKQKGFNYVVFDASEKVFDGDRSELLKEILEKNNLVQAMERFRKGGA